MHDRRHSIHATPTGLVGGEMKRAQDSMPLPIDGCPNVYHCGYHSELSFGAAAYLICRPEGNIMVDSPRFTPALAKRLEARALYSMLSNGATEKNSTRPSISLCINCNNRFSTAGQEWHVWEQTFGQVFAVHGH